MNSGHGITKQPGQSGQPAASGITDIFDSRITIRPTFNLCAPGFGENFPLRINGRPVHMDGIETDFRNLDRTINSFDFISTNAGIFLDNRNRV